MGTHANFKKDLAARLAHKAPYIRVEAEPEKRLDLLIVVNQIRPPLTFKLCGFKVGSLDAYGKST